MAFVPDSHTRQSAGRILFLDDEQQITTLGQRLLQSFGYQTDVFNHALLALEVFRMNPFAFDVVIVDHNMPEMTGTDFSKLIHASRPDIPIILCSGSDPAFDDIDLDQLGVQAFLAKPFTMSELLRTIEHLMEVMTPTTAGNGILSSPRANLTPYRST